MTCFFSMEKPLSICGRVNGLYSTHCTLKVQWQPVINPDLSVSLSERPEDERLGLDLSQRHIQLAAVLCVSARTLPANTMQTPGSLAWDADSRGFQPIRPVSDGKMLKRSPLWSDGAVWYFWEYAYSIPCWDLDERVDSTLMSGWWIRGYSHFA